MTETKRILKSHNLRAFKSYSQNFVVEPKLLQWHIQYSDLTKEDEVVEIGAGFGALTKVLAEKSKKVIAIEVDPKFIAILQDELASYSNIEIIEGDILKIDSNIFDRKKIISNPPYKISSPLTFKIIKSSYTLSVMTYQREFAERLTAEPKTKDSGRLTMGVNYYAMVDFLKVIPKSFFYPAPKVESALIRLKPKEPPFQLESEEDFFEFIRSLFSFRGKSVQKALTLYLKNKDWIANYKEKLAQIPWNDHRIFQLSLAQFHELYQFIQKLRGN